MDLTSTSQYTSRKSKRDRCSDIRKGLGQPPLFLETLCDLLDFLNGQSKILRCLAERDHAIVLDDVVVDPSLQCLAFSGYNGGAAFLAERGALGYPISAAGANLCRTLNWPPHF
jgi:hypothetical protein